MKILNMLLFFTIFFLVYGSGNFYIYLRGRQALSPGPIGGRIYLALFLFLALSFLIGRFGERIAITRVSDFLIWTGSFWFAFILYFLLAALFFDIVRGAANLLHIMPDITSVRYVLIKRIVLLAVIIASSITISIGYWNACTPRMVTLDISVPKKAGKLHSLSIVMVSDIHLGTIIGRKRLRKMLTMVNGVDGDIILLAGDIVDENLAPVIKYNLGELLKALSAPYGVWAVTGNHEYIGGAEKACSYLTAHGIKFLRDRATLIDNAFYLAGREDLSIKPFTGKNRKPLAEILEGIDQKKPLILMDHQPFHLEEAVKDHVDLQLSGHTHDGQLWPVNYITGLIFTVSHGYLKIGESNFYISSGFGTWGPPVRVGTQSEIVRIRVKFL